MLSIEEVRQLERLVLGASSSSPSAVLSGHRFTRARGYGVEFQDFRPYQHGDDLRSIDWTIDARLRQLVVRVFRAEGQVRLHLLVDVSASMGAGRPSKLACASKVAAALSHVATSRRDAVGLTTFDDRIRSVVRLAHGRPQLFRILEMCSRQEPAGRSDIARSLTDYGAAFRGPGLVVVLSDFYQPGGCVEALRFLVHRGLYPAIVHVVSEDEMQPDVHEPAELTDLEDPGGKPLLVSPGDVEAYREKLAALTTGLRNFSLDNGLPWLRISSSTPFDSLLHECVRAGLLAASM